MIETKSYYIAGNDILLKPSEFHDEDDFHDEDEFGGGYDEGWSVSLLIGPPGALLIYVTDYRDVDSEFSMPPGLTQPDFQDVTFQHVTNIDEFQKLVDTYFPNMGQDILTWFKLSILDE